MRIGRTLPPAASPIYVRDILSGLKGIFRGRHELERFESELKDYFGVKYLFLTSSGKAALTMILRALMDLYPDRDEVLIPAFTCYSVPSAITRAGLKVRLCDIDPNTLDFNFDQLSKILSLPSSSKGTITASGIQHPASSIQYPVSSNRLLAIIPVHLFGIPANIEGLREVAKDQEISIIEDAAQAMGVESNGKKLGIQGGLGFFSLGRGKALSTVEGGIIITDRDDIAEKITSRLGETRKYGTIELANLFSKAIALTVFLHPSFFWLPKLLPFLRLGETIYDPHFKIRNMSSFQAGLARGWREKLGAFHARRVKNSQECYSRAETGFTTYHLPQNGNVPGYIRFPVRLTDDRERAKLLEKSDRKGLGIMPSYPDAINGISELRESFEGQDFPMAKKIAKKLVTLPIHPFLSQKDREQITTVLSQISDHKL